MNATAIILLAVLILAAGLALGIVITRLFGQIRELRGQVKELRDCQQKRLPHRTADGVEDAQAVNMDLVRQANELEVMAQALRLRAAQQSEILKLVRQGPDAYDPDRPAGKRP